MGRQWRIEYEGTLYHVLKYSSFIRCTNIIKLKLSQENKLDERYEKLKSLINMQPYFLAIMLWLKDK